MLLSDLVLGCTRTGMLSMLGIQPVVYACILATTALGQLIKDRRSVRQVGTASLAGSLLFFVVTMPRVRDFRTTLQRQGKFQGDAKRTETVPTIRVSLLRPSE